MIECSERSICKDKGEMTKIQTVGVQYMAALQVQSSVFPALSLCVCVCAP